jgi:hypothetical protein
MWLFTQDVPLYERPWNSSGDVTTTSDRSSNARDPDPGAAGANFVPLYERTLPVDAPAVSISTPLIKRDFRKLAIRLL